MFSSLLLIAVIGGGLFGLSHWRKLPESERKSFAQKGLLWGAAVIILVLVFTGRAHWLMTGLAALLALAARVAQFGQYVPMFKKVFGDPADNSNTQTESTTPSTVMTKQQAAEILGVDQDAKADEVRMAHKKLMQKIHPDRGGTDALAKQINAAKDVLLS